MERFDAVLKAIDTVFSELENFTPKEQEILESYIGEWVNKKDTIIALEKQLEEET